MIYYHGQVGEASQCLVFSRNYMCFYPVRLNFENHLYGHFRHYNKSRDLLSHRIGYQWPTIGSKTVIISRELNRWEKDMNVTTEYDIIIFLDMLDFPRLTLISATTTIALFPTLGNQMTICTSRLVGSSDLLIPI